MTAKKDSMTSTEQVTTFSLEGATARTLIGALNAHLVKQGLQPQESSFRDFSLSPGSDAPLPKFRWLIAFAVEGANEGHYCHIAALDHAAGKYTDIGFCKPWTADSAYKIATEAQQFLTAAVR